MRGLGCRVQGFRGLGFREFPMVVPLYGLTYTCSLVALASSA